MFPEISTEITLLPVGKNIGNLDYFFQVFNIFKYCVLIYTVQIAYVVVRKVNNSKMMFYQTHDRQTAAHFFWPFRNKT